MVVPAAGRQTRADQGPHLAWTLITLANGAMEWLWLALGVAVGAWLAR